jgi:hypothetical protein
MVLSLAVLLRVVFSDDPPTQSPFPRFTLGSQSSTYLYFPGAHDPRTGAFQRFSTNGWTPELRIGTSTYSFSAWYAYPPNTAFNLQLEPHDVFFGAMGIISMTLTSHAPASVTADLALYGTHIQFANYNIAFFNFPKIGPNLTGFRSYTPEPPSYINWRFRDYPMVTDAATYWFGTSGSSWPNRYGQVEEDVPNTINGVGISWTWHFTIEPNETIVFNQYLSGGTVSDQPLLDLSQTVVPRLLSISDNITLKGSATSERGEPLSLVIVFDEKPWTLSELITVDSDVEFNRAFTLESFHVNVTRSMRIDLYAIDFWGSISQGWSYNLMAIGPTPPPSISPRLTNPKTVSRTAQ